jgi:hypothetical protein
MQVAGRLNAREDPLLELPHSSRSGHDGRRYGRRIPRRQAATPAALRAATNAPVIPR